MKFKYYKVKNNGDIAKTATYYDNLTEMMRVYLRYDCNQYVTSNPLHILYEFLPHFKKEYFGDLELEKEPISYEDLTSFIKLIKGKINDEIKIKKSKIEDEINELNTIHTERGNSLEYIAFEQNDIVKRYKELKSILNTLNVGRPYVVRSNNYDGQYVENLIDQNNIPSLTPELFLSMKAFL